MLFKEIDPELLRRAVAGDEKAKQEIASDFWERQFLRKYGFLKIPEIQWPPRPQPDPSPDLARLQNTLAGDPDPQPSIAYRLFLYDYILSGLIRAAAGDPDPEPNLVGLLTDPRLRLAAAKQMIPRLNKAIEGIGREIEALEKSLGNTI